MNNELRVRVAETLGWTIADTQSVSVRSLRELVRTVSPKLYHELTLVMFSDVAKVCYCGVCGVPYRDSLSGRPVCINLHPLCVAFGTEREAEIVRAKYAARTPPRKLRWRRRR